MRKTLIPLVALLIATSCSLEEVPKANVTRDSYYRTPEQCESALRSLYAPINNIYKRQFLLAVEGCSDIWFSTTSDINAYCNISPASPGVGSTVWTQAYIGVMRANECIDRITNCRLAEEVRMPMQAEARAMRAFFYYILTSFFGDVPYYTYPVSDLKALKAVRKLPRMDASEIRQALYEDLQENALPYLDRVRACDITSNHAGFPLAAMLMAKFALWNKDYDAALAALDELEAVYGEFNEANYPLEEISWKYKNTAEGIYEIQHAWSTDGARVYGDIANIMCAPSNDSGVYDGVYMPELSVNGFASATMRCTKHYALWRSQGLKKQENAANFTAIFSTGLPFTYTDRIYSDANTTRYYSKLDMDAVRSGVRTAIRTEGAPGEEIPLDKRIFYKFGMGNLETGEIFATVSQTGMPFGGPQFWCYGMVKQYDANNYRIFRYADAVLMRAECYCMQGLFAESVEVLNKIRRRANLADFSPITTAKDLLTEIQNERARELGGEFQRKFDLVRWGIWYEQTDKYSDQSKIRSYMRPCHRYYPIPDTECALTNYVLSNPEYE